MVMHISRHNGVVEWINKILIKRTRVMLRSVGLLKEFCEKSIIIVILSTGLGNDDWHEDVDG